MYHKCEVIVFRYVWMLINVSNLRYSVYNTLTQNIMSTKHLNQLTGVGNTVRLARLLGNSILDVELI